MPEGLTAETFISIHARPDEVWKVITTPATIKEFLMGTNISTDWKEGSTIDYQGEWQGKQYHDKGVILKVEKDKIFQSTYWSSMSGLEDKPENYKVVTYKICPQDDKTILMLSQTNIDTPEQQKHSIDNWHQVLKKIKEIIEKK